MLHFLQNTTKLHKIKEIYKTLQNFHKHYNKLYNNSTTLFSKLYQKTIQHYTQLYKTLQIFATLFYKHLQNFNQNNKKPYNTLQYLKQLDPIVQTLYNTFTNTLYTALQNYTQLLQHEKIDNKYTQKRNSTKPFKYLQNITQLLHTFT